MNDIGSPRNDGPRAMNITLRQLRAFLTVSECGSFTEAAAKLHLTQSGLSVLVRELERELGVRVLDRASRKVQLSEAGRHLFPHAQRILNELGAGLVTVGQLRDKQSGVLRVAAPQLMACTLLPRAMAAYRERYPRIEIFVLDTMPETFLNGLAVGDVELALGPDIDTDLDLVKTPLLQDRHLFVSSKAHPLAARKSLTWDDVRDWPFIAPTQDFTRRLNAALDTDGSGSRSITPAYTVSYMTTALGMVAAGLGVTALPSYAYPLVTGWGLQMRPLDRPAFHRELCIFSVAQKSLSPAAQSFVEHLREYVKWDRSEAPALAT